MEKNGFTLVELLATVVILGILMTGAIIGVTKYLDQSRNTAYKAMESSAYDAMQNYLMDNTSSMYRGFSVNISLLVDEGYLEEPIDPVNKNKACSGTVEVIENNSANNGILNNLKFKVEIICSKYKSGNNVIYPKE